MIQVMMKMMARMMKRILRNPPMKYTSDILVADRGKELK
jgi:hypothetical protein